MSSKIFKYLSLSFIKSLLIFHIGVSFIILIADFTENIRKNESLNTLTIFIESFYKIPFFILQISPFVLLLSALYCIRGMVLRKELDIFKSFGISIWSFLFPFILISLIWGGFLILIVSPLSVAMMKAQNSITNQSDSYQRITPTNQYIWIFDKSGDNSRLLATKHLSLNKRNNTSSLSKVIYIYTKKDKFNGVVIAQKAIITESKITFYNVTSKEINDFYPQKSSVLTREMFIEQDKITNIADEPHMIKIWNMPQTIKNLEDIGFSSQDYKIYFYNLLTIPILLISMVLISTRFSLYDIRKGKNLFSIIATLVAGFLAYFFINFANVAFVSINIPPLFSVLISKFFVFLVSINLVFNKEGL